MGLSKKNVGGDREKNRLFFFVVYYQNYGANFFLGDRDTVRGRIFGRYTNFFPKLKTPQISKNHQVFFDDQLHNTRQNHVMQTPDHQITIGHRYHRYNNEKKISKKKIYGT